MTYIIVHMYRIWLAWLGKNGQAAGTSKIGYRMEGLQIRLVSKDAAAPGKNANYYTEKKKTATIAVKDQMHLRALAYASNTRYLILVDTTANRVGIYSGSVGKWNEVKSGFITTGAKSTPTVKGTFTVQEKENHLDLDIHAGIIHSSMEITCSTLYCINKEVCL